MTKWQPIETCPENTWVLVWFPWLDHPAMEIGLFKWETSSEWETITETAGASGARRQTRQEKIIRERRWENGGTGSDGFWMPLPEQPAALTSQMDAKK